MNAPLKSAYHPATLANGWAVDIIEVTPELAAAWLNLYNHGNRKMRRSHVKRMALLMENDEFSTTPQGIIFGLSGTLLDGQHRLQAIVETGITQSLLVIRHVDDSLFTKVDQGAKRSMVDLLGTDRRLQEPVSAIARMHFKRTATPEETSEVLDAFGPTISYLLDVCGGAVKVRSSAPVRTGVALRMVAHPDRQEDIAQWYRAFVHMDFSSLPPSILALFRQADAGKLSMGSSVGRNEVIARTWATFDPNKTERSKIQINDPDSLVQDMREVIAHVMSTRGSTP